MADIFAGGKLGTPLPYRGQPEPVLPDEKQLEAVPEGPCQVRRGQCCLCCVVLSVLCGSPSGRRPPG